MKTIIKTLLIALSFMALPIIGAQERTPTSPESAETPLSPAFKARLKAGFSPRTPLTIKSADLDETRQKRKLKKDDEYPRSIKNLIAGGPKQVEFVLEDVTNCCSILKQLTKPYCFQLKALFDSPIYGFIIECNQDTQEVKQLDAYFEACKKSIKAKRRAAGKVVSREIVEDKAGLEFVKDESHNEFIYNQVFVLRAELKLKKSILDITPSTMTQNIRQNIALIQHLQNDLNSTQRRYIDPNYTSEETVLRCAFANANTLTELKALKANGIYKHCASQIDGYEKQVQEKEEYCKKHGFN